MSLCRRGFPHVAAPQVIVKAGKKIQDKVGLDTLSAKLLRAELLSMRVEGLGLQPQVSHVELS